MAITVRGQGRYEILHGCGATSTNSYAYVTDSSLDVRAWVSVDYRIDVLTNSINWQVWADNDPNFGTEVVVQAEATVAANASGTYAIVKAPYTYYRIKIKSTVAETHGVVSVYGLMTG
jgi:hypothetical protein